MYSAMHVVKAMTSWFVTFSISSMRSTVKSAWSRIHCASSFVMPDLAELGLSLARQHLDFLPDGELVLKLPDGAHGRARVAVDHNDPFRG